MCRARYSFLVFVITCLVAVPCAADWIKLGSWNIENLGRVNSEITGPKPLAEAIHLAGLDIIALQEIYDNDGNSETRTNTQLDGAFRILNKIPGNEWTYEMLPNRFEDDTDQLVVIAWNKARVKKIGGSLRIEIDRESKEWHRHPHAIKFSAGQDLTDIVVIPVHMKADYRGDFAAQRGREAQVLVERLPNVRSHFGNDSDIVILGDLNCDDESEGPEPALHVFASAGFIDLNANGEYTHFRYGPLDRILVPRGEQEFVYSRQYILRAADSEAFDDYLSDHQIILTPIRILKDDD